MAARPRLAIGRAFGDSLQEFTRVVAAKLRREEGIILVADLRMHAVRAFTLDGRYLRSFGREGRGPGELVAIHKLFVYGDTLTVVDDLLGRLTSWALEGTLLETRSRPRLPGQQLAILDRCPDGSLLAQTMHSGPRPLGLEVDSASLYRIGLGDDAATQMGFVYWKQIVTIETGPGTTSYTVGLSPQGRAVCAQQGVWYTSGTDTSLKRFIDGVVAEEVELPVVMEPIQSQDVQAFEDSWLANAPAYAHPRLRRALREMPFPDVLPMTDGLVMAQDGHLWVAGATHADDAERAWYVVSPGGVVIARATIAAEDELLDAGSDFVIVKRQDEQDVDRVLLYDIVR